VPLGGGGVNYRHRVCFSGGERQKHFPALRIFRQCPCLLLIEVHLKEGKTLGNGV
jgi:hypothetical protein